MANFRKPPITKYEVVLSTDASFGYRDYFICRADRKPFGRWVIEIVEIDIDIWIDYIKTLNIDYSDDTVTAYCLPGHSFKEWWKSLPQQSRPVYQN